MRIFLSAPYEYEWYFGRYCAKALRNLGHEVKVFDHRKNAIPRRFGLSKIPLTREIGIYAKNLQLKREVKKYKPDFLFVLKGEIILPKTIEWVRKRLKIPTVLWFPDDPQLFDSISKHIGPAYDIVFTSSVDALDWYKYIGVSKVKWIGFACDPEVHKRITLTEEEKRKYGGDICFVGSNYPERLDVIKDLPEFDLRVWGSGWDSANEYSSLHKLFAKEEIFSKEMVSLYNARKIVLNIHHNEMKYGGMKANWRVYEATGCGAFLLTDKPKGIS